MSIEDQGIRSCEHGDHPAPAGKRFCSPECQACEHDSTGETGCDGICQDTLFNRRVTNSDPGGPTKFGKPRKGGLRKGVWFEDSVVLDTDIEGGPSRYGPGREYVANCASVEIASRFVEAWNAMASPAEVAKLRAIASRASLLAEALSELYAVFTDDTTCGLPITGMVLRAAESALSDFDAVQNAPLSVVDGALWLREELAKAEKALSAEREWTAALAADNRALLDAKDWPHDLEEALRRAAKAEHRAEVGFAEVARLEAACARKDALLSSIAVRSESNNVSQDAREEVGKR